MRGNLSQIPVTIKQLTLAMSGMPDEAFRIDGKEVYHVSLVGVIRSVNDGTTNRNYTVTFLSLFLSLSFSFSFLLVWDQTRRPPLRK